MLRSALWVRLDKTPSEQTSPLSTLIADIGADTAFGRSGPILLQNYFRDSRLAISIQDEPKRAISDSRCRFLGFDNYALAAQQRVLQQNRPHPDIKRWIVTAR